MKLRLSKFAAIAGLSLAFTLAASAAVINFDHIVLGGSAGPAGVWNGNGGAPALSFDGVGFHNNNITTPFAYWSGFAFSNHTDTTTEGYGNEFSAITGSGADGSTTYAVGYYSSYDAVSTEITLGSLTDLAGLGMSVTNTTLTALTLQNGLFGASAFTNGDYLILRATGYDGLTETGFVDFYLADFRDGKSLIVTDWALVDLSALGTADRISFTLDSTDTTFIPGIGDSVNTPTYFALDNFLAAIPEPSSALLSFLGLGLLTRRKR